MASAATLEAARHVDGEVQPTSSKGTCFSRPDQTGENPAVADDEDEKAFPTEARMRQNAKDKLRKEKGEAKTSKSVGDHFDNVGENLEGLGSDREVLWCWTDSESESEPLNDTAFSPNSSWFVGSTLGELAFQWTDPQALQ